MSAKRDRVSYELGKQGARKLVRPDEVAKAPHVLGVWMEVWRKMSEEEDQPDLSASVLKAVHNDAEVLPKAFLGLLFGIFTDDARRKSAIHAYSVIMGVSREIAAARLVEFMDTTFDLLPMERKTLALDLVKELAVGLDDCLRPVLGALFRQLPPGRAFAFREAAIELRILDTLIDLVNGHGLGDSVTVATSLYVALRLLRDAQDVQLPEDAPLRRRLGPFIASLWSKARPSCLLLGRDLARVTSVVASLREAGPVYTSLNSGLKQKLIDKWPSREVVSHRLQPAVLRHVGLIVSKLAPERAAPSYDRILGVMMPRVGQERIPAETGFADIARYVLHNLHPAPEAWDKAAPARARLLNWCWEQLTNVDMRVSFLRALFWDWFQYTPQSAPSGASPGDAAVHWTLVGPLDFLAVAARSRNRESAIRACEFLLNVLKDARDSQQRVASALDGLVAFLVRCGRRADLSLVFSLPGPKHQAVIKELLPKTATLVRNAAAAGGKRQPAATPDSGDSGSAASAGALDGPGSAAAGAPVSASDLTEALQSRDSQLLEPMTPQVEEDTRAFVAALRTNEDGDWGVRSMLAALAKLASHAPLRAIRAALLAGARLARAVNRGSPEPLQCASSWLSGAPQSAYAVAAAGRTVLVGSMGHRIADDAKCPAGALAWSLSMSARVGGAWLALEAGRAAARGNWRETMHAAKAYAAAVSLRAADWHIACSHNGRQAVRPWSDVGEGPGDDGDAVRAHPLDEPAPVGEAGASQAPAVSEAVRCALVVAHDHGAFAKAATLRGSGADEATAHFWLGLGSILAHAEAYGVVEALRSEPSALSALARSIASKPTEEGFAALVAETADASSAKEARTLIAALRKIASKHTDAVPPAKRPRRQ